MGYSLDTLLFTVIRFSKSRDIPVYRKTNMMTTWNLTDYCLKGIIINNYVVNQKKHLIEELLSSTFKDNKVIVIDETNSNVVNSN